MRRSARRAALFGLLAGLATAAVAEAVRPRGGTTLLLDWDEGRRMARSGLDQPTLEPATLPAAEKRYRSLADKLEKPFLKFVGPLPKGVAMPPLAALDPQRAL